MEITLINIECGECGIPHAIPKMLYYSCKDDGKAWFCPSGHRMVFTETKSKKLQEELNESNDLLRRKKTSLEFFKGLSDGYKNTITAYKGHLTRIKKNNG